MPTYVMRARTETLGHRRDRLARALTGAHTRVTGTSPAAVRVLIEEYTAADHYIGGRPATTAAVIVHGYLAAGADTATVAALTAAVQDAAAMVLGVEPDLVWVYLVELDPHRLLEGGPPPSPVAAGALSAPAVPPADEQPYPPGETESAAEAAARILLMRVLVAAREEFGNARWSLGDLGSTPDRLDDDYQVFTLAHVVATLASGRVPDRPNQHGYHRENSRRYTDLENAVRALLDPATRSLNDAALVRAARAAAASSPEAAASAVARAAAAVAPPTPTHGPAPFPVVRAELPPEPA